MDIPRRCRIDLMTPAELAIYKAAQAVEEMPADVRLTDAVILLSQARDKVADYVDRRWHVRITTVPDSDIIFASEAEALACVRATPNAELFDPIVR